MNNGSALNLFFVAYSRSYSVVDFLGVKCVLFSDLWEFDHMYVVHFQVKLAEMTWSETR